MIDEVSRKVFNFNPVAVVWFETNESEPEVRIFMKRATANSFVKTNGVPGALLYNRHGQVLDIVHHNFEPTAPPQDQG